MCDVYCQTQWQAVILTNVSCGNFWTGPLEMERPARWGMALECTHKSNPSPFQETGWGCPNRLGVANWIQISVFPLHVQLGANEGVLSPSPIIWTLVPSLVYTEPWSGLSPCFTLQLPLEWEPWGTPSEAVAPWRPPPSPGLCRFIHLLQLDSLQRTDLGAQGSVFSSAVPSTTCGPS